MHVLSLEDDDAFAESLRDVLHEAGYALLRARSVVEARRLLGSGCFDVVLVDLDLGETAEARGRHLLDDLASLAGVPPMLIVSGAPEAPRVAREFGIACVRKPVDVDHLLAAIRSTVDHCVRPIVDRQVSGMRRRVDASVLTSIETPPRARRRDP
jgi:DNA-binding response OmpR family regulator